MTAFTPTKDQENALNSFITFLADPIETVWVLKGYSGTGKTTLIRHLLGELPKLMQAVRLLNPKLPDYEVALTATTNKAAENFGLITGMECGTIHSFLGLRIETDRATNTTQLVPATWNTQEGYILFIDEASYIDSQLLGHIFKLTKNCKIVFMGDPAQLTPVKSHGTPVFDANFRGATLSQVVRQSAGNPIVDLSAKFRETVTTGEFFSFRPDGQFVKYLDRDAFDEMALAEFSRPDWGYHDSKILAWTNKRVVDYNHAIQNRVTGNPNFQVGDYALNNKYVSIGRKSLKTDQMVCITGISPAMQYGVSGNKVILDYSVEAFFPHSLKEKQDFIRQSRAQGELHRVELAENWVDLRAAYAQTVNKSQGSTYNRVFIDLDDIRRCNNGETIARMLYVGVSRARHQVIMTGDLV